jgi:hypothetical protein
MTDAGPLPSSSGLLLQLAKLFAVWVGACIAIVYLLNTYTSEGTAAPIVSLLDSLTPLLPLPMLVAAAMQNRSGGRPSSREIAGYLLGLAVPLNIAFGFLVLPEIRTAQHATLFSGIGEGAWRLSPGTVEAVVLGTLVPLAIAVHFLVQRRTVGALAAEAAAAREQTREAQLAMRVAELERDRAQAQFQAKQAELAALQAQIEPHFIYNTLANVQYLVENDAKAAGEMLGHLIRYLKASIPRMRANGPQGSTLEQEFESARALLEIVRLRLGHRLSIEVHLPEDLKTTPFPPTVVQTLIENAIKHGIERKPGPVSITLAARRRDDRAGFGSTASGVGVGLKNTRERLQALHGKTATVMLLANQPTGVRAVVSIPAEAVSEERSCAEKA